jgi:hypothetical protein
MGGNFGIEKTLELAGKNRTLRGCMKARSELRLLRLLEQCARSFEGEADMTLGKTYECSNNCGRKFVAVEARPLKWICSCGGKIVAGWWGKPVELEEEKRT